MIAGLFWIALYAACVMAGLTVAPGLPEAFGFAVPALLAAIVAAWLSRRLSRAACLAVAVATAAVLMVCAVTGVAGRERAAERPTALTASPAKI